MNDRSTLLVLFALVVLGPACGGADPSSSDPTEGEATSGVVQQRDLEVAPTPHARFGKTTAATAAFVVVGSPLEGEAHPLLAVFRPLNDGPVARASVDVRPRERCAAEEAKGCGK